MIRNLIIIDNIFFIIISVIYLDGVIDVGFVCSLRYAN